MYIRNCERLIKEISICDDSLFLLLLCTLQEFQYYISFSQVSEAQVSVLTDSERPFHGTLIIFQGGGVKGTEKTNLIHNAEHYCQKCSALAERGFPWTKLKGEKKFNSFLNETNTKGLLTISVEEVSGFI